MNSNSTRYNNYINNIANCFPKDKGYNINIIAVEVVRFFSEAEQIEPSGRYKNDYNPISELYEESKNFFSRTMTLANPELEDPNPELEVSLQTLAQAYNKMYTNYDDHDLTTLNNMLVLILKKGNDWYKEAELLQKEASKRYEQTYTDVMYISLIAGIALSGACQYYKNETSLYVLLVIAYFIFFAMLFIKYF